MVQFVSIPMTYEYKGSSNCCVHLIMERYGIIKIYNDYRELMCTVTEGRKLAKFITDLEDGKYA